MMNPTEKNIRASWALNCAVANLAIGEREPSEPPKSDELFSEAVKFLHLLDRVKSYIEPPMKEESGKSKAEKKEVAREETLYDHGDIEEV